MHIKLNRKKTPEEDEISDEIQGHQKYSFECQKPKYQSLGEVPEDSGAGVQQDCQ